MGELQKAIETITYRSNIFPKKEFRVITENQEEALPYLRAALDKAIQEKDDLDPDYMLHFYALFLLGQFQDTSSFQEIIELVSLPSDTVDYLLGDAITEGISDILYNTYDGNLTLLEQMVTDKNIDEFIRGNVINVLGQLYLDGRLGKSELKNFLSRKIHEAGEYDFLFNKIADVICKCHFVDMLPEIRYMFDNGLMDEGYLGEYDSCVDLMFEYDEDEQNFCESPIDAARILSTWAMFKEGEKSGSAELSEKDFEKMVRAMERMSNTSVHKKKIGRNDPCPCGSGKKYKFCCMNKPKEPVDDIETPEERRKWLESYPAVGGEHKPGRIYLEDYYDRTSIDIDQILYLGIMHRPGLIWERNEEKENMRTKQYLYLAYQKASELAERENVTSFTDFDEKHSIHYRSREWAGMLLELLKKAGDKEAYKEVQTWVKKMKG